jgi:peptidoglycan-N-acetylglucosamine deacetylase
MEADDDEGGANSHYFLLAIVVMVMACNNPQQTNTGILHAPQASAPEKPPAAKETQAAKSLKKIYLTFDDGPNTGTGTVMHILKEQKAPAAFFIVGEHINGTHWQRVLWDSLRQDARFEMYNHSYTHALHNRFETFYKHPDTVYQDFVRARDSLGLTHNICRSPGRNSWRLDSVQQTDIRSSKAAIDSAAKEGLQFVGWDLQWHYESPNLLLRYPATDMKQQIDSLMKKGTTQVPGHLVLLAHDQTFKDTKDSANLVQLITLLRQDGRYELELLSKYPLLQEADKKHRP